MGLSGCKNLDKLIFFIYRNLLEQQCILRINTAYRLSIRAVRNKMDIFIILIILLGLLFSLWLRTRCYRQLDDVRVSPLSQALQDLIGVAGGIYLSLIMLVSFLKLTMPEKITLYSMEVDPLALFSLCLGIVQPIVLNILKRVK